MRSKPTPQGRDFLARDRSFFLSQDAIFLPPRTEEPISFITMASPKKKSKRSSLADAFGGLDIASASPNNPMSPAADPPRLNLARSIRQAMKSAFLPGGSMRARSGRGAGVVTSFTIAMDGAYDYNILGDVDPDDLYEEMARYTTEVCELIQTLSPSQETAMEDHLVEVLVKLVYSSNMIENAGAGWDVTLKLCQAIFRGDEIPDDVGERDPEYTAIKQNLLRRNLPAGTHFVLRSRREIIQHAKAASYMINELYLRGKDLTEEIILETHRILTYKVDTEQGISWTEYSGVYRRDNVQAGLHEFVDWALVRTSMKRMISSMNQDLDEATKAREIDPVAFSAKYCHDFVNIHPFLDGNGRTCRLILNALLLKYGGNIVCIGEQGDDRERYLALQAAASQHEASQRDDFDDDDPLAPQYHKRLASFTLEHFTGSMRKLAQVLKRKH